ncbi:DUF1611 domain-containing protein [Synechococcus sp. RSCCF101]|uniref:DUF1611 domain-containing protein n=1 Tax=Synechococcus sp. RSCCF101 TaxID=2511069 RepID=UPI001247713A|nr:DUF1611 domain-containing protein [Synechococcus sp. RSCCF101]QEY30894.1 DUF1611 domain-containing protein [Synechococcus sp. RSCCF101]QEY33248.1 DUF1611 domain-containing protein [Synechococcus sp. RSCCF101]
MPAPDPADFPPLRDHHRVVLLQHGGLKGLGGKTGLAMLRYRSGPIVAVVDPEHAGGDLQSLTGVAREVPVVASIEQALGRRPEVAVIGLAPSGGRLSGPLRRDVLAALRHGLCVANGLHTRLADDEEVRASGVPLERIWDLRREPPGLAVAAARAAGLPQRRVLAIGTDMAVGKMSACLEVLAAARRRGVAARFVGTGQAGILISGRGVALDAVRVDYAPGAVEGAVLGTAADLAPDGLVLVEGQGSLCHPGSSATLPLLRGSQPTDLLMVHRAGQTGVDRVPGVAIPPLDVLRSTVEAVAAMAIPAGSTPPGVRALALNTSGLGDTEARAACHRHEDQLGLVCDDPVRHGADRILEALLESQG